MTLDMDAIMRAQGQSWGLATVIAAVVAGIGAHSWFVAAVRGGKGDR